MIHALLAISVILVSSCALADEQLPLNIGGGGAADLLNQTKLPANLTDPDADSKGKRRFKVKGTCTESGGRVLNAGDAGYDECMAAHQLNDQPGAPKRRAQPGANISLGR